LIFVEQRVPRYAYHRTFAVKFPDKCVWKKEFKPYSKWGLIWYVDRSKTSKGNGVGVCRWGLKRGHNFSSGFLTTICQDELYIINSCIVENIEKSYTGGDRYIQESSSH